MAGLDLSISQKVGDMIRDAEVDPDLAPDFPEPPDEVFDGDEALDEPEDPDGTRIDADDFTPEAYDEYLASEILLPHGGEMLSARVVNRAKDKDG